MNDAAAFPVVYTAALYGTGARVLEAALFGATIWLLADGLAAGLKLGSVVFDARAFATAAFAANILALDPAAPRLILLNGSALSSTCSAGNQ